MYYWRFWFWPEEKWKSSDGQEISIVVLAEADTPALTVECTLARVEAHLLVLVAVFILDPEAVCIRAPAEDCTLVLEAVSLPDRVGGFTVAQEEDCMTGLMGAYLQDQAAECKKVLAKVLTEATYHLGLCLSITLINME